MFCSVLKEMPFFCAWLLSEEEKLKLVKPSTIHDLFSNLERKNKFTKVRNAIAKFEFYGYDLILQVSGKGRKFYKTRCGLGSVLKLSDVDAEDVALQEMTNWEFLKKFIKEMIDLNKLFRAMPKWKRMCQLFLPFVLSRLSGIAYLVTGISEDSKFIGFAGILIMCAWAGLICSLVFHLSLAVLIPSAIILGFGTIYTSVSTVVSTVSPVQLQVLIYKVRQKKGTDIDKFFNLVDEINQYLDTNDLPQEKISLSEQNYDKSPIDEKIKEANTKKDDKEGSSIKTEKSNDEKDGNE